MNDLRARERFVPVAFLFYKRRRFLFIYVVVKPTPAPPYVLATQKRHSVVHDEPGVIAVDNQS